MGATAAVHPADPILQAYSLGKLDQASGESVSQHLEVCSACQHRVAEMLSDNFLGWLRDARGQPGFSGLVPSSLAGLSMMNDGPSSAPRPPTSSLPPGLAEHPDYEVIRELGQGGMGTVYLALNRLMGRHEVLKVVSSHLINRRGVLDRFLGEIRNAARLHHTNIVTAYSASRIGESIVFAMEYVDGLDLAKLVKAKGPLPVANACNYVHQAALGLQHANELGMVHRDIKPSNLMLTRQGARGVIKVLDFGLAKIKSEGAVDAGLTHEGQMLGTPDFIAPEQIRDARSADVRADIYSLGCTLYYLLTGGPPFHATSLYEILQAHHSMDALPLNLARPEVPVELAALVARMMAKEPERRFQTSKDVAQALLPFFKMTAPHSVATSKLEGSRSPSTLDGGVSTGASAVATQLTTAKSPGTAPLLKAPAAPMRPDPSLQSLIEIQDHDRAVDDQARSGKPIGRMSLWIAAAVIGPVLLGLVVAFGVIFRVPTADGGTLIVLVNEPGAEVTLDKKEVRIDWDANRKHAEIRVKPGEHIVEVTKDGFTTKGMKVAVSEGAREIVAISLEPAASGVPKVHATAEAKTGEHVEAKTAAVPSRPSTGQTGESPHVGRESVGGFVPLFNGKDLAGWITNPAAPVSWEVFAGAIHTTTSGRVYTVRNDYRNFHLRMELMAEANCIGSVFFRSTRGQPRESTYAVRINTVDARTDELRTGSLVLLDFESNLENPLHIVETDLVQPNRWFLLEIIGVGSHFEVRLDGKVIVEADDPGEYFKNGYIALHRDVRSKGGELSCRKIEINDLSRGVKDAGETPKNAIHRYRVTHLTPGVSGAGTNEWVFIYIKGPHGQFKTGLDLVNKDDREAGQIDTYEIRGPGVHPIQELGVQMKRVTVQGNWKWRCGWVQVEDVTTGRSVRVDDFGWIDAPDKIYWKKAL